MEQWNDGIGFLHLRLASRGSGRDLRTLARSSDARGREAAPFVEWHRGDGHQSKLANHETDQPWKGFLHETVGMQAYAEHVHAKPRETRHDVAEERHDHQAALSNESAPARVQNDGAPKDD